MTAYFIGVDAGKRGGAVLVSCNKSNGLRTGKAGELAVDGRVVPRVQTDDIVANCEIIGCIDRFHSSALTCCNTVDLWSTLYAPALCCIERVGVVQRQKNNDVLIRSMGFWEGILTCKGLEYITLRPSRWKRWANIPCAAGKGGSKAEIKRKAVDRAQLLFPLDEMKGARGGYTVRDWFAESAMLALCARQYHNTLGAYVDTNNSGV